jgi:hypothetical protein
LLCNGNSSYYSSSSFFLSFSYVYVTGNITAKLCEVGSEFNIFCTLVTMATAAILNLFNPPTAATHYSGWTNFAAVAMEIKKGGI